jgi:adenylate cyclase
MENSEKTIYNILLVDDRPENVFSLENMLADEDRVFFKAFSGNDALKIAYKENLSLILLDVQMPEMDGFETAELLKANNRTKNIPIIFVTAINKETKYILRGLDEGGAIDYLFKPLDTQVTRAKVAVLLKFYLQKKLLEEQSAQLKLQNEAIMNENKRSEELLLNILPQKVAEELKEKGETEAKQFDNVTVLFTDFVGFTNISEQLSPKDLVAEVHLCFTVMDIIVEHNGLEKIKTIGDAYLAVCGLPNEDKDHAKKVVKAAKEILVFMKEHKEVLGNNPGLKEIRIGIHSGSVVAGIVGIKKFAYDIWSDTVNTAARMEQSSEAGKINISAVTYDLIKDEFPCTHRGKISAKNKGEVDMYFVDE